MIATPNYVPEIAGVLDALAARLEPVLEPLGFRVNNRPSAEGRPVGSGEVFLAFDAARYEPSPNLQRIEQKVTVQVVILVRFFDPRSQVGAYQAMSAIRRSLVGYNLVNCEPIQIVQEFYSAGPDEAGAHEYRQVFTFESMFMGGI